MKKFFNELDMVGKISFVLSMLAMACVGTSIGGALVFHVYPMDGLREFVYFLLGLSLFSILVGWVFAVFQILGRHGN